MSMGVRLHARWPGFAVGLAGLLLTTTNPARSQEVITNPFTAFHSMQTFDEDGERVQSIRIPVYITLRSWEERSMGLRLRLAASIAETDLARFLDQGLDEIRVLSFVPGVEFVFPIGENHMLRPFVDAGAGTNNGTDDLDFLGDIGMRTEFIFPTGGNIFAMEPGIRLSVNAGGEPPNDTRFNSFVTLTARRVLGWRIGGYLADAGAYFEAGYNFQTFEIASITSSSDDINRNFEVGLGFGFSYGRPRIGPFEVPRVRIGYRFGDLEGFRFRLGGDWLTTLREP